MANNSTMHRVGNNYSNINFYLNSEGEPVAVEPSQQTVSVSPESPDPTSDHNSPELHLYSIKNFI